MDGAVVRGERLDHGLHELLQLVALGDLVRHAREVGNAAFHQPLLVSTSSSREGPSI